MYTNFSLSSNQQEQQKKRNSRNNSNNNARGKTKVKMQNSTLSELFHPYDHSHLNLIAQQRHALAFRQHIKSLLSRSCVFHFFSTLPERCDKEGDQWFHTQHGPILFSFYFSSPLLCSIDEPSCPISLIPNFHFLEVSGWGLAVIPSFYSSLLHICLYFCSPLINRLLF